MDEKWLDDLRAEWEECEAVMLRRQRWFWLCELCLVGVALALWLG